jgi:antitoxin ParD1/3/4
MLEDQHVRARLQQEELRAAIAAGVASGPGKSANAVFARLEAKYRKQGKRAAQFRDAQD